jgi:hypothetical protein
MPEEPPHPDPNPEKGTKEEETPCYLTGRDLFLLFTRLLKSTTKKRINQSIPVGIPSP